MQSQNSARYQFEIIDMPSLVIINVYVYDWVGNLHAKDMETDYS